ncbi:MAG TPA: molybdopterin molybdotransferase MoeA [Candidatus Luteococcus avicola]|nr:molybdopterin molybdotransferase MoeA [Candidatus Luteococcus avicola]
MDRSQACAQVAWRRTVDEHRAAVLALAPAPTPETIGLDSALGRVLASQVSSRVDMPGWTNSAMDGFAVRFDDLSPGVRLPVTGDLPAGHPGGLELPPGVAMRIMTGAPLPGGADTVVPVELTDIPRGPVPLPAAMTVHELPERGGAVRERGEDAALGSVVAPAGARLDALTRGVIAAVGVAEVAVWRTPTVTAVATGDEVLELGTEPSAGQLVDCNSWLVHGLAAAAGNPAERCTLGHDDADRLRAALPELTAGTDLLVFTGGVSAGAYEVVRQALTPLGVEFGEVAMQPGKPQGLGRIGDTTVLCLPGNPVSAVVSFLAFGLPWLDAASGRPARRPVQATVADGWHKKPGREQFMPVVLNPDRTVGRRSPEGSGSHFVTRLAGVHGFARIPAAVGRVEPGTQVEVMMVP